MVQEARASELCKYLSTIESYKSVIPSGVYLHSFTLSRNVYPISLICYLQRNFSVDHNIMTPQFQAASLDRLVLAGPNFNSEGIALSGLLRNVEIYVLTAEFILDCPQLSDT